MKRFNHQNFGISIYDESKDSQQPLPQDYGISYSLIEEYEQKIEDIEKSNPYFYNPSSDIALATFAILFLIALCYAFSGNEHAASYLIFPAILIPAAYGLNLYLTNRNISKREQALKAVRSEVIERYLKDLYEWYNDTHEYKHQYHDIV